MALFDFIRPPPQMHAEFGSLQYTAGHWRGTIALTDGERIPLHVPGSRDGPHPDGLRLAEQAREWWAQARLAAQEELFAHYSAGSDDGELDAPKLLQPGDVWRHVVLSSVQIKPYDARNEMRVAIRTAWDDEHTLGALIRDGRFVELNGSILEPR